MRARRLALVAVMVLLVAAFFALRLDRFLTLEQIKLSQARFHGLYEARPLLTLGSYAGLYALMAALSLPGAAVMTLAGAALFGFWPALLAVSFASTLGATGACAASRFLLRNWVRERFQARLERMDAGLEREGAFYLFSLRLIPAVPFFVINLAMGLTPMRLWTFYWVSQAGMLPGTMVYVNAGTRLGEIESLSGIASWPVLASLALLGLFPLAARAVMRAVRARRGHDTGLKG